MAANTFDFVQSDYISKSGEVRQRERAEENSNLSLLRNTKPNKRPIYGTYAKSFILNTLEIDMHQNREKKAPFSRQTDCLPCTLTEIADTEEVMDSLLSTKKLNQ